MNPIRKLEKLVSKGANKMIIECGGSGVKITGFNYEDKEVLDTGNPIKIEFKYENPNTEKGEYKIEQLTDLFNNKIKNKLYYTVIKSTGFFEKASKSDLSGVNNLLCTDNLKDDTFYIPTMENEVLEAFNKDISADFISADFIDKVQGYEATMEFNSYHKNPFSDKNIVYISCGSTSIQVVFFEKRDNKITYDESLSIKNLGELETVESLETKFGNIVSTAQAVLGDDKQYILAGNFLTSITPKAGDTTQENILNPFILKLILDKLRDIKVVMIEKKLTLSDKIFAKLFEKIQEYIESEDYAIGVTPEDIIYPIPTEKTPDGKFTYKIGDFMKKDGLPNNEEYIITKQNKNNDSISFSEGTLIDFSEGIKKKQKEQFLSNQKNLHVKVQNQETDEKMIHDKDKDYEDLKGLFNRKETGSFLIRHSKSKTGQLVITLKYQEELTNIRIIVLNKGSLKEYHLEGSEGETFYNLKELIDHYKENNIIGKTGKKYELTEIILPVLEGGSKTIRNTRKVTRRKTRKVTKRNTRKANRRNLKKRTKRNNKMKFSLKNKKNNRRNNKRNHNKKSKKKIN